MGWKVSKEANLNYLKEKDSIELWEKCAVHVVKGWKENTDISWVPIILYAYLKHFTLKKKKKSHEVSFVTFQMRKPKLRVIS